LLRTKQGYKRQDLPVIVSMVTFPSTEIIVAAARGEKSIHGKKAKELKQLLYGKTDLRKLGENEFQEQALDFITPESINDIFKAVPESRLFIQTLSQDFSYASDAF
jgi:hypothetical protein